MRRLILEVPQKELSKAGIELPPLKKIKSLDLLYFLRQDREEFAVVSRVEFTEPPKKVEDFLTGGFLVEAQVLEQQKNGAYIVFTRSGPISSSVLNLLNVEAGYLFPPLGISDGKVKVSFLGNEQQIKDLLEKLDAIGIHYRVTLLGDANFPPTSPLNLLTEKQREILLEAHRLGYYDIPRKITTQELANRLALVDSTVVEHLRKAEQRLITQLLEQNTH